VSEQVTTGSYLVFKLGDKCLAIHSLNIREIVHMMDITVVPDCPNYCRGIINLRGRIIPIIDLPTLLGWSNHAANNSNGSAIVIVKGSTNNPRMIAGILANEVFNLETIWSETVEGGNVINFDPTTKTPVVKIKNVDVHIFDPNTIWTA
jgi:purine-binding chemotaxis protein CheW